MGLKSPAVSGLETETMVAFGNSSKIQPGSGNCLNEFGCKFARTLSECIVPAANSGSVVVVGIPRLFFFSPQDPPLPSFSSHPQVITERQI